MKIIDGKPTAAVTPFTFTTDRETRCRVTEIDYQRNGVCGMGFFVLRFQCSDAPERPLIGVVFDYNEDEPALAPFNPRTAVIDPSDLATHWRGDTFDTGFRAAIAARYDEIWTGCEPIGSPGAGEGG